MDEDASLTVRDGKLLIPVNASNKKNPGFVYDSSSTGKTAFVQPVEIIELENEIAALQAEEAQEIQHILAELAILSGPMFRI